ncbi:Golgi reassembly-stacking protein 2 [Lobosporangium transversale]|uniref:GRASP55/65 PDZ-like domain-domain-containing protein n=1 Tax=Lobosporangium transversale TaxID=64571 RepID=A0A1Y2GCY8_9FUNG|nr:GRASP55/65 PDZ-like domain-domain-containing protein [Lobosporangium transversale]KAF9915704.1 Golgi reassembly-stacking protein 2 [Lobosporangium transversale]ORZ07302.1 GRASP55/65 PDZ-like domain-domain-containing protein [Lobosporangium transversale]|eukprot:XP_021877965.1 GRASP55/65 PDZ-like domain-domain-containing protein [Lobosporangium transversale]
MGNTTSGEEGRHRLGYHVLRVKEGSPAFKAGIRPFFDYIVAINGVRLNTESTYLQEQMQANEGRPVMLDVYSTREQAGRRVEMIPTRNWGDGKGGLIGCSIRFCMFDAANDVVWHILDVAHGSPAEKAGLCAHTDYVIGTPYGIMRGEGDLYDLIEDNIGEPLRLHVYNSETDHVREIVIIPNEEWGGEGLLGCDVGYGYLHRLPRQGSIIHHGAGGSPRRTPSLPYPPSQEMVLDNSYRNTMPASFQSGEQSLDIVAPTPRPPHSPPWLNPGAVLEGSLQSTVAKAATGEEHEQAGEQGLPPLRFGRGERPDAEDEPESEDEFVPRNGRSAVHQGKGITTRQSASPTDLKQLQAPCIHGNDHIPNAISTRVTAEKYSSMSTPHTSLASTDPAENLQQQQYCQPQASVIGNQPHSPSITKVEDVNSGDIPFGTGDTEDFSSQLGVFQHQQFRH